MSIKRVVCQLDEYASVHGEPIKKIVLGLKLPISSSQGFYKKITSSKFKVDEDLKK